MRYIISMILYLTSLQYFMGQSIEQAIQYNDEIIEQNEEIIVELEGLMNSYEKYNPNEMDSAYISAVLKTKKGIDFIKALKPFKGDKTFKNGAFSLFKTYLSVLKVEHKRIIEILKLPENDFGEKEVAEFDKLIESVNSKLETEFNKLSGIQKKFAEVHHFEIDGE